MSLAPTTKSAAFWLGDALTVGVRGLELDGVPLVDLARKLSTPVYVYGSATISRRVTELLSALRTVGAPTRVYYAMKANRFGPVLELLRRSEAVGIDACSPREVERAMAAGFHADEISMTAGMLSNRDLTAVAKHHVHLNLDSTSAIRRWATVPGAARSIGLRIDPGIRVGWGGSAKLSYDDGKFGFSAEAVLDVVAYARSLGLEVDTLHIHAGWGLQEDAAPLLAKVYARLAELAESIPTVQARDRRSVAAFAGDSGRRTSRCHSRLGRNSSVHTSPQQGARLACEPGTFIVASAGVLLAQVNTVEVRHNGNWIGVDAGHNVNVYAAHYGIPMAIVPVARPHLDATEIVNVAGNINEANDVFARDVRLPPVAEEDLLAFFPAGAYGASMASDHCLRGLPTEELL